MHVSINPGKDFVSFRAVSASKLVPHKHVLMSYGMKKVAFTCRCGRPIV